MKGIISGIKRMEIHDGDGLRTTVFFKGCPLKCVWCHNPESISPKRQVAFYGEKCILCGTCNGERSYENAERCPACALVSYGREYTASELVEKICADEPFWREGGGVTLSGGECLMQADFAVEVARLLHKRGISVYVDTCGHAERSVFERIIPYTDKFLYDIKAKDIEVHKECTGKDNNLILENLKYLSESGCKIEIRYPLVKGYNDGECVKIAKLLVPLRGIEKVKVLKYHSLSASRYHALGMENTLPKTETELNDMERAVKILKEHGLYAVNGENED